MLTACFTEHGACTHTEKCNVREPLRKVHEGILRLLSSITISDMSQEERGESDVAKPPVRLYALATSNPPAV